MKKFLGIIANVTTILGFFVMLWLTFYQLPLIKNELQNLNRNPYVIPNLSYNYNKGGYQFNITNYSRSSSNDLYARLSFSKIIEEISIESNHRIKIIEGGEGKDIVTFKFPEIIFEESQSLYIKAGGENFKNIDVWSESEGDITNRLLRMDGDSHWWKVGPEYTLNKKTGEIELVETE